MKYIKCAAFLFLLFSISMASSKDLREPLRIASFNYPPFMYASHELNKKGMVIEIVEEAFKRMNQPIEIKFYPFARSIKMLEAGEVDGMITLKKTALRAQKFFFTHEPLTTQDYVVFVRKNSEINFSGKLKDLQDLSIGVLNGASYGEKFDKLAASRGFRKIDFAQSHESNFRKLLANRMDAVVCSRDVGIAIIRDLMLSDKVKIIGPPIESTKSLLAISKKFPDKILLENFDLTISKMREDGTLRKIREKYHIDH